jgi:hypothetical protein
MLLKRILFALFVLNGCSLFEPRASEPPEGIQSGRFIQPDRPEIVLENLSNAVMHLNVQNFLACLDEQAYTFFPAQNNSTTDPDLWRNWGRTEEQLWFNNIRSAATVQSGHQLQLTNVLVESVSQNRMRYTVGYSLTIYHNRTTAGIPIVASGSMTLALKADERGLWFIERWTDLSEGSGGFSWSDLRSAFIRG